MSEPNKLAQLELLLSELRARYQNGDKSVELRLRSVMAQVEQLRLEKGEDPIVESQPVPSFAKKIAKSIMRRCCR